MLQKLPPTSVAKGIFGNDKLRALYQDVDALRRNVGTQPFALAVPGFERQGAVAVFDEVVDVSGQVKLAATLDIRAASAELTDLYGTGGTLRAPAGASFADFSLKIGGGVGAQGAVATGPLQISAKGSLGAGIDYRHLLPVKRTLKRARAFADVLKTTRPPQLVELSKKGLAAGEVHRLEATLNLDFGLDVKAGRSFALRTAVELFDGLPAAGLEATGELALSASLGLSMYERMYLAIGREERWARVRLQRERERRIGFSAMMALRAEFDLGGGLAAVLEQALGQSPVPRLTDSLRKLVDPVAAGDWETIKASLTGDVADAIGEFVDDSGWKEWLAGSAEVTELLQIGQRIVGFYDGLDSRVQSLWDQLLGKADLSPGSKIRVALARLGNMDNPQFDLDSLLDLSDETAKVVDLLESLSGRSLEDILLGSASEARDIVAKAAGLARKAEALFDREDEIVGKIRGFVDKTGIGGSIDTLRQVQSKEQLAAALSQRLEALVERLVGKAWDQIGAADLAKVQRWAQRIHGLLEGAAGLQAAILQKIRDVRGEVGFSLGIEISRVSAATALLDVEIDLESEARFRRQLQQALTGARVRDLLNALAERADDEGDAALPFRLRECAFTSRRVRASSVSFLLAFLGPLGKFIEKQQGISRRVEESAVRVRQVGDELRRQASFSGGFQRTEIWNKTTSESAVWLEIEAADTANMPRLEARFGEEVSRTLRATYSREDNETAPAELAGLEQRLVSLGFVGGAGLEGVPPMAQTRVALDIRLPGAAIVDFCSGVSRQADWDRHYLSAARCWFHDRLVGKQFKTSRTLTTGAVLDAFVDQSAEFRDTWRSSSQQFRDSLRSGGTAKRFRILVEGQPLRVQPLIRAGQMAVFDPAFDPLGEVVRKRGKGFRRIGQLRGALATAGRSRTPAAYRDASRAFADGWKAATACSSSWPTPTFGLWLLMTQLAEDDPPRLLGQATGVATLRWKSGGDWQGPVTWRLVPGRGLTPTVVSA